MQLRHWKSVSPPSEGMNRVTCLCWSADGKKLAVATTDRVVTLYDEEGNKKDKIPTKPSTDKVCFYLKSQNSFILYLKSTLILFRDLKPIQLNKWHCLHYLIKLL